MAARLGIHVIGPQTGESIILELPDGGVGVIDSFGARHGRHPVVGFLERQWPTLTHLRFFAVTHPHADHCFRAAEVLNRYPAEEAWIFRPFPAGNVQDFYLALRKHKTRDRIEAALGLPAGSMADSILQLDKQIDSARKTNSLKFRYLACSTGFRLCAGALCFHFLTPGDEYQRRYARQTCEAAQAIFDDGRQLEIREAGV